MESNITLPWRCDIGGRVRGLLVKFSCADSWEKAHVKFASKKTKPPLSIAEENLLVLANYSITHFLSPTYWKFMAVGTLKDGYVHKVPLPRVPLIQYADTCYSAQVPRIPTWSDLTRSLVGLGRNVLLPFSPLLV